MSVNKMVQNFELKFWGIVIPLMAESGLLMKITRLFSRIIHAKVTKIILVILVWAAVGFVSGLILGRFIWMFKIF